ncbi:MAG: PadR family transcriptional regulator [Reyranellaceae bacterium]
MDVKTLCLAVLSRGEASGYEIRKEVADGIFNVFSDAGYGSIYPALSKLTEEGHVTLRELEQEKRPDKKVYRITPMGRMALLDALRQKPAPDKFRSDFMLIILFAHLLPARDVDQLVTDRIALLRTEFENCERSLAGELSPGERFICLYGAAVYKASIEFLEENRHEALRVALLAERKAG